MDKFKKIMIGGRVPAELGQKVKYFADENNCNSSNVVEKALLAFFSEKQEPEKDDFVINLKDCKKTSLAVFLEVAKTGCSLKHSVDVICDYVIKKVGSVSEENYLRASEIIDNNLKQM